MSSGKLCDSTFVCKLMKEYMDNSDSETFLVDGFPRSQDNIDAWTEVIGDSHNVKFMCLFDVSGEEMKRRLCNRAAYNKMLYDQEQEVMEKFPWHKATRACRADD